MNKITSIIFVSLLAINLCNAQTTIVLQPDSISGKDSHLDSYYGSSGTVEELNAVAWTASGNPMAQRGLVEFDLSSIPSGAVILSASLTLYFNPNSAVLPGHSHMSGSNAAWLQRITTSWQENTVTWNTQPSTTTVNEVALPQDASSTQDYISNVTALVQDMIDNPSTSFGFMLKQQTEQYYRGLVFASSDNPNYALHPKLEITYVTGCTNLVLQPDSIAGKDSHLDSYYGSSGSVLELNAVAWTASGSPMAQRGLIEFDLSSIPSGAIILSASLTLYFNPNSAVLPGHSHMSGSNAAWLQRITTPWQENTVTWNVQPSTTTLNQVTLPQDASPTQDYIVDVTALVQNMVDSPATSHGFMLKQQTEQYYRGLVFASSDNPNYALHPKLDICYNDPNSVNAIQAGAEEINISPNPVANELRIKSSKFRIENIDVYDLLGARILQRTLNGENTAVLDVRNLPSGIYFVKVIGEQEERVVKFAKQ